MGTRVSAVGLAIVALAASGQSQPFGLGERVENTTLRMPSEPDVYASVPAFTNLRFREPVALASPPGETNRLFVVEQAGRIVVITNLVSPTHTVFLDISDRVNWRFNNGLLGLAFHPEHADNGFFYIFYTLNADTGAGSGPHQRVARFQVAAENRNEAIPSSEVPLITAYDRDNDHNGGDLKFGPDGYLYVTMGDEGRQNDGLNNSQRIDLNFWSSILRLDVDQRPGNLPPNPHPANSTNYLIPADNPFIGLTNFNGTPINPANIRTEMYAIGLRQPWRISFDSETGHLYCGEVGQDLWEEVNIIVRGGNYGWAFREGVGHPGPKPAPVVVANLIDPILEYSHHGAREYSGNAIIGGVVYRGNRLPELYGCYVFADFWTGNLWQLRYDGTKATDFRRLTSAGAAGFGIDPSNGDVLMADWGQGWVSRLVYTNRSGRLLPPTLAATGAFADVTTLTPSEGVVPYDVNVPFWSDGAHKQRWFSIPRIAPKIGFLPTNHWSFPSGMIWIQHFELELTNGVAASRRRLETRILVRDNTEYGAYGVTYRWDTSRTNATLVPEEGLDETFLIHDGDFVRTQLWRYPSRNECLSCHTPQSKYVLGFNTAQLNRDFNYNGVVDNQLRALWHAGYLGGYAPNVSSLPALAPAHDETVSLEYRVRSFLMANCSHCHQPGAAGQGFFDARLGTPTASAGLVGGALINPSIDPQNRVITPGSPSRSMLLARLTTLGVGRMPPVATTELDQEAISLVSRWIIDELPFSWRFPEWQLIHFGSTNALVALADADPDGDGAPNRLEWLTGTDPESELDSWNLSIRPLEHGVELMFSTIANRGFDLQWTSEPRNPRDWQSLNSPQNRLHFSSSPGWTVLRDVTTNEPARYYRVRVQEP